MAFVIKDAEKTENNKQHLNLSIAACEVMQSDMLAFGENSQSSFLNKVFEFYHPKADASISLVLNSLEGELTKTLSAVTVSDQDKRKIINTLLEEKKNNLLKKTTSYEKGNSFKFWLNQKNLKYLTSENSECNEEQFYSRRGMYIRCVIEEYARLPYVERELIYFTPYLEAITQAIRAEQQLRIVASSEKTYSVYPFEILRDPLSMANYLVGFCRPRDSLEAKKQPCSFRISALQLVEIQRSRSAFLKGSEKKQLYQLIVARGVQFMVGGETEILVKLTKAGVNKYKRQAHLRPVLVEKRKSGEFAFNCTEAQAEYYFFKFGEDAEILLPLSLREKFMTMYENAAHTYVENR